MGIALVIFISLSVLFGFFMIVVAPLELQLRAHSSSALPGLGVPISKHRLPLSYDRLQKHFANCDRYHPCEVGCDRIVVAHGFIRAVIQRTGNESEIKFLFPVGLVGVFCTATIAGVHFVINAGATTPLEWIAICLPVVFISSIALGMWYILHRAAEGNANELIEEITRVGVLESSGELDDKAAPKFEPGQVPMDTGQA